MVSITQHGTTKPPSTDVSFHGCEAIEIGPIGTRSAAASGYRTITLRGANGAEMEISVHADDAEKLLIREVLE